MHELNTVLLPTGADLEMFYKSFSDIDTEAAAYLFCKMHLIVLYHEKIMSKSKTKGPIKYLRFSTN